MTSEKYFSPKISDKRYDYYLFIFFLLTMLPICHITHIDIKILIRQLFAPK